MSRAFTKETAESALPPERMVDNGPNLVTPEGLAQIDTHIARIEASMKTEANVLLRETLARDLRYWEIRKASAEVAPAPDPHKVSFGSTVTIQRKGRTQTFRVQYVGDAVPETSSATHDFGASLIFPSRCRSICDPVAAVARTPRICMEYAGTV